jgi:hypothetical protein
MSELAIGTDKHAVEYAESVGIKTCHPVHIFDLEKQQTV